MILKQMRQLMKARNLSVFVLPRTDEHQSEYLCRCDEHVHFLSGFSGSSAIALVSESQALLWTDSRYFLQAEKELQEGWQLRKMLATEKKWNEHIAENYPKGTKVSINANLLSAAGGLLHTKFFAEKELTLDVMEQNIVNQLWGDRPKPSVAPIFLHEEWAGRPIAEKVKWVQSKIAQKKSTSAIFNELSQIGWILNLRSDQIPCSPFFKAILIIQLEGGKLHLPPYHPSLNAPQLIGHLAGVNIKIHTEAPQFAQKALIVKSTLNYQIYRNLKQPIQWQGIGLYRAVRAQKQIDGFRRCHRVDGIAMAKFWSWRSKQKEVDEYVAAMHIDSLRKQQPLNKGISFFTISAGGPNGAVVHYHPVEGKSSTITQDMIHLVDSGGQYLDGTTDVTRAFHFGQSTPQEKDAFTRVLLGNLDIERQKWPNTVKVTGHDIDILARRHLWNKGLDYMHGTGHGVGYFQGVHEGPVGIYKNCTTVFQPGMIVTNEPGYYETGKFGIRIENILVCVEKENLLGFENLTLCPYDKNLIDATLLRPEDVAYINQYHEKVYNVLTPELKDDKETIAWLRAATTPL